MKKKVFAVWMIIACVILGSVCGSRDVAADAGDCHEVDNVTLGSIENTMVTAPYDFNNSDSFEFLRLLNEERVKAGLNPVQMDADLLCDAQQRAAEIALVSYEHERPAGWNATPLKKGGAENIGMFSNNVKAAFERWKASPAHYANLMSSNVHVIGVAHYNSGWVWLGTYSMDEDKIIVEQNTPIIERREIIIELGKHSSNFCVMRKDMKEYYYPIILGNSSADAPHIWEILLENDKTDVVSVNKTVQFYACEESCTQAYGSPSMYTWSSSNAKVAKVDVNGLVTTLSEGTTVISCTPKYGGTAATYRLTVGNATRDGKTDVSVPKVKKNIKVKVQNASYKVTNIKKQTVTLTKAPKTKKVVVPASITINGKSYKVTSVGKKAFAGNTRLTQVTIGKNVKKIETKAFYGCKKLKKVVYKGKKSKISKGSKAFGKCNKLKKKYK